MWLFVFLAAVAFTISGFLLNGERAEINLLRSRIDTRWADLELDIRQRVALASELLELADRGRVGVPGKDFLALRNSLAGSLQGLVRATDRASMVEANLILERALRRFTDSLDAEQRDLANQRLLPGSRRVREEMLVVEHRVALHRTAYNEAVQRFNTHLALFPANFAAIVFGIKRYPHYMPTDTRDLVQLPRAPLAGLTEQGKRGK